MAQFQFQSVLSEHQEKLQSASQVLRHRDGEPWKIRRILFFGLFLIAFLKEHSLASAFRVLSLVFILQLHSFIAFSFYSKFSCVGLLLLYLLLSSLLFTTLSSVFVFVVQIISVVLLLFLFLDSATNDLVYKALCLFLYSFKLSC